MNEKIEADVIELITLEVAGEQSSCACDCDCCPDCPPDCCSFSLAP